MDSLPTGKMSDAAEIKSDISDQLWKHVMPLYAKAMREWSITISPVLYVACVLSLIVHFLIGGWATYLALSVFIYAIYKVGYREGNVEGFQIGYEWGREDVASEMVDGYLPKRYFKDDEQKEASIP